MNQTVLFSMPQGAKHKSGSYVAQARKNVPKQPKKSSSFLTKKVCIQDLCFNVKHNFFICLFYFRN